jgi:hypothetical protein
MGLPQFQAVGYYRPGTASVLLEASLVKHMPADPQERNLTLQDSTEPRGTAHTHSNVALYAALGAAVLCCGPGVLSVHSCGNPAALLAIAPAM